MMPFYQQFRRGLRAFGLLTLVTSLAVGQPAAASLSGEVRDDSGAWISGVAIAVIRADGRVTFVVSDPDGRYFVKGLLPGRYTVWAWSKGFSLYEGNSFSVRRGRDARLDIPMEVGIQGPRAPGGELFRITYAPARSLRPAVKSDMGPSQVGALMTELSTDFRLSLGSDSVGRNRSKAEGTGSGDDL